MIIIMVFYKYYLEIKNRLLLLFLMWITTVLVGYYCKETLLFLIIRPTTYYSNENFYIYFIFTDATEIFSVFINIVLFFSNQIVIIYLIYHFLVFILLDFLKLNIILYGFFLK